MTAIVLHCLVVSLLSVTYAWDCQKGKVNHLMQIDAGHGQVVATDTSQIPYSLRGSKWSRQPGSMTHITVGPAGTWGVNKRDEIYKYVAGDWVLLAQGSLKQVDAGGDQFIVGTDRQGKPFCLGSRATLGYKGPGSPLPWKELPGNVKYFSCGPFVCWAVNKDDSIFFMNPNCENNGWSGVDGKLSTVEVATDGSVFGVNSAGDVFTRDGVTSDKPWGAGWSNIPMKTRMKHVTYDLGRLWVIAKSGMVFMCTL
ncbi:hypothetical protein DPEC_G00257720 [Dallia pectoralis]|uniref:Uncharacterized protein n=1 Tax=Dallia pectoralis TaxID=75939 RepID=A0ACC2FQS8_DALPE|nr:hypothetical protein DPEC_G00257720 [Dallia pectoralis]